MSLTSNCRHIVDCANHCASYNGVSPRACSIHDGAVCARNPTGTYNSASAAKTARQTGSGNTNHKYYELTILKLCVGYSEFGETYPGSIAQLSIAEANSINSIITYINKELARRGLQLTTIGVAANNITQSSIINLMNDALNLIRVASRENNPTPGSIMYASNPNSVITALNAYAQECICYTDCTNYSLCSCHGYCNNY